MEMDDYQSIVVSTRIRINSSEKGKPTSDGIEQIPLLLGVLAEAGSLAKHYRKNLRDGYPIAQLKESIIEDLGDTLWYVASLAKQLDVKLSYVAAQNLQRTKDRYGDPNHNDVDEEYPTFERGFAASERFPRKWIFQFVQSVLPNGLKKVTVYILEAEAVCEDGTLTRAVQGGRLLSGFDLAQSFGDPVDDNAHQDDAYRFHDAIHIAFMTVLNWSPVVRGLTKIKRRTASNIDRVEDGARARDLEEALSAILKEFSRRKNAFAELRDVDGEVRDVIRLIIGNLEVKSVSIHQWAEAINMGYQVMTKLEENMGGYLLANLDTKSVVFFKDRPTI